ncbi:MAG: radical SAM protein [Nanoarchaeota archaeon]|nr:radical SAM protein [Nanoarchaeota archaeon]
MKYDIIRFMRNRLSPLYFAFDSVKDIFRYKLGWVSKTPYSVMIETNNLCNLRCSMCSTKNSKRKKGFMDMGIYTHIIEQCAKYGVKHIALHTVGEPLIHPKIIDMVKFAKSKGLFVLISTNGQLMNAKLSKQLVDSGLDMIRFSLEGYTKNVYEKIRIGGSFDKLVSNIKQFRKIRGEQKKPLMEINSVLIKEDMKYAKNFYRFWRPLVDRLLFSIETNQASYSPHIIPDSLKKYFVNQNPCFLLWSMIAFTWDGKATACCIDFENRLMVGDIKKNTLSEIWNNKTYKRYRQLHMQGRFYDMPLCGACDIRKVSHYQVHKLNKKIKGLVR